jgi:hypothetical protein
MLKALMLTAAVCMALATTANAASRCDEAQRTALETKIKALPDGEQKTAAMAEWELSTKAFNDKNVNDCDTHMEGAMNAGGIKDSDLQKSD